MPQFDIHLNPGPMRATVPMVVVVQSSLFEGYRRRVVVPLVLRSALPAGAKLAGTRMNPVFKIKGQALVLHPLDMVSVASDQLGPCVGNLADQGQAIADALDELLTRSWG
ncbi:CcdB family protein [Limnohabitans planktonicus]|uniref:Toxin CcdB n=1 Tax=Limnohabitans planktonicus II-D5 TaxID=1293045 RepID=A0A2T7UAU4_9BURK|nr:CcdB family protein [Limnohabitans planktonicus]PVE41797.1 plasmid maintenance protein CcdB [Limnohabitans planktonicus II-D5]